MLFDLVRVRVSTTGTGGPLLLGIADGGGRTMIAAGVPDGTLVSYGIADGGLREAGRGTYSLGGNSITRTFGASTTGAPLNLSGNAVLEITPLASDFAAAAPSAPTRIDFASAGALWIVNHNLGRDALLSAYSPGGIEMMVEAHRTSANQVQITFDEPTAGYVLYF